MNKRVYLLLNRQTGSKRKKERQLNNKALEESRKQAAELIEVDNMNRKTAEEASS